MEQEWAKAQAALGTNRLKVVGFQVYLASTGWHEVTTRKVNTKARIGGFVRLSLKTGAVHRCRFAVQPSTP